MTIPCPTPRRVSHPTEQAANRQRINDLLRDNATLYPYKCRCGHWHLTPSLHQELPTYRQAKPEDVQRVRRLGRIDFTALVDADAKRTAAIADRLALRHPDLLTRWRWTLKTLQNEVRDQLTKDGPDNWRAKAQYYADALTDRLTECQSLRTQASAARAA